MEKFPLNSELAYAKKLNKFIDDIERKFREILKISKKSKINSKNDEKIIEIEELSNKNDELIEYFLELLTTEYASEMCIDYLLEALNYTIEGINADITTIKGINFFSQPYIDIEELREILKNNVALIKAEPGKYLRTYDDIVSKLVEEKIEKGLTLKELSDAISKATGIEKNRANLIAADQVGNVYAQATKAQFKGIGLKKFKWVTARDKRVRPSHQDREGKIYSWDNPPDGEIPGSAIRCRCVADVVEDEVLNL